jgi:hypothetical protein
MIVDDKSEGMRSKYSWSIFLEGLGKTTKKKKLNQNNRTPMDSSSAYTLQSIASWTRSTLENRLRDLQNTKQECLPHHNT